MTGTIQRHSYVHRTYSCDMATHGNALLLSNNKVMRGKWLVSSFDGFKENPTNGLFIL